MNTHNRLFSSIPKFLTVATVAVAVAVAPAAAEAACGNSAADVAAELWEEFHEEAIAVGCAVAGAVAEVDFAECLASATLFSELLVVMVSWWNDMVDNSWATLGRRELEWDATMNGTVWATDRLFCSATPSDLGAVEIRVEKLGGSAETEVEICKMFKDGTSEVTHSFGFASGTDNIGTVRTRQVTGAHGKFICVFLKNKSAGDRFQYELSDEKY